MGRIIVAGLLAIISVHAFSQKGKPETLFTVKDEAVSSAEFMYIYKKNHQAKEDYTDQKIQEYLQRI